MTAMQFANIVSVVIFLNSDSKSKDILKSNVFSVFIIDVFFPVHHFKKLMKNEKI